MPEFVCLLFMCKGLCSLTMEAHTGGAWGPVGWVFRHQVQRALRLVTDGLDFVLKGTGSCCKLFRWEWLDRTRVCDMCGSWMVRRWGGGQWHYQLGVPEKLRNIRSFVMVQGEMGSAWRRAKPVEINRIRQLKTRFRNKKDQDLLGNSNRKNQGKSLDLYFSTQVGDAAVYWEGKNWRAAVCEDKQHFVYSLPNVWVWTEL